MPKLDLTGEVKRPHERWFQNQRLKCLCSCMSCKGKAVDRVP